MPGLREDRSVREREKREEMEERAERVMKVVLEHAGKGENLIV